MAVTIREGKMARTVRMKCQNCGDAIADVVCEDGILFNRCRCCGAMRKRRNRATHLVVEKRKQLEALLKELLGKHDNALYPGLS